MDETVKPLRIPAQMSVYADKHDIFHMIQSLVSSLVIDQPDDPISYLISLLQTSSTDLPRVMLLGPPAVGKHTMAKRLSTELQAIHVTLEGLLEDRMEMSALTEQELLVQRVQQRLKEPDCFNNGWVLEGIPQTRLQALGMQRAGVLPRHVVMLEAPVSVLLVRNQARMLDPLSRDVYHKTFMRPVDAGVAQQLDRGCSPSKQQVLAELQWYRCQVTGLRSAYQHALKVVDAAQPLNDVYQDVLAFVQNPRPSRITTPRILLLGPPGSGKSHQAALLSEKYKIVDVCCDQLMRTEAAGVSALGEKVRLYLDQGSPVPELLVNQILQERLSRLDCSCRGWVLYGVPIDLQLVRNLQESQYRPNRVFFLESTDDICLERITLRATDPVIGQRYHAVSQPAPNSEVKNRLQTRPEDRIDAVTQRLLQYRSHVAVLKSVFPDAVDIDTDQDPGSVFVALESRLKID